MRFRGNEDLLGTSAAGPPTDDPRSISGESISTDPIPANPIPLGSASPARRRQARPASREPLFFVVVVLLTADILFGLGLAVFAERILHFRPMAVMGVGLATLGLGILAYFILLGDGSQRAIEKKRSAALDIDP